METELSYEFSNKIEKSFQLWIETNTSRRHHKCKTGSVEFVNCQDLSIIITVFVINSNVQGQKTSNALDYNDCCYNI